MTYLWNYFHKDERSFDYLATTDKGNFCWVAINLPQLALFTLVWLFRHWWDSLHQLPKPQDTWQLIWCNGWNLSNWWEKNFVMNFMFLITNLRILALNSCCRVPYDDCARRGSMPPSRTLLTGHTEFVDIGYRSVCLCTRPPLTLTCRVAPPQNQPWLGWSPGGRHCDSRSCNTPALSRPMVHLYAASPLCIWPSPSGLQYGWRSESRCQITEIIRNTFISVTFVLVTLLQKSIDSLHNNNYWPTVENLDWLNKSFHYFKPTL